MPLFWVAACHTVVHVVQLLPLCTPQCYVFSLPLYVTQCYVLPYGVVVQWLPFCMPGFCVATCHCPCCTVAATVYATVLGMCLLCAIQLLRLYSCCHCVCQYFLLTACCAGAVTEGHSVIYALLHAVEYFGCNSIDVVTVYYSGYC